MAALADDFAGQLQRADQVPEPDLPEPTRSEMIRVGYIKINGPDIVDTDRYASADAKAVHGIVEEIVKSSESRQLSGEAAVELMLNQKPTASFGANFVADARNGTPIESVLADLAASDAYFALDVVK